MGHLASAGVPERYRGLAAARWALATLSSRTMFLEGDEAGVLMPFGDLHNHGPPPGPQLPDLGPQLPSSADDAQLDLPFCLQQGRTLFIECSDMRFAPRACISKVLSFNPVHAGGPLSGLSLEYGSEMP